MRTHLVKVCILCGLTMMVAGCTNYYKINDPAGGKLYYTTKIEDAGRAGAVKFKDAKSGSTVTLQSSEVKQISSDEYSAGLNPAPVAAPAAVAPAAPAAAAPAPAPAAAEPAAAPASPN